MLREPSEIRKVPTSPSLSPRSSSESAHRSVSVTGVGGLAGPLHVTAKLCTFRDLLVALPSELSQMGVLDSILCSSDDRRRRRRRSTPGSSALLPPLILLCLLAICEAGSSHKVLPLVYKRGAGPPRRPEASPGNATAGRLRAHLPRRLLGLATLRLTGSVEDGSYYAAVGLGTPPQPFELIIDTGSTLMFVPCKSCGDKCGGNHVVRAGKGGGRGRMVAPATRTSWKGSRDACCVIPALSHHGRLGWSKRLRARCVTLPRPVPPRLIDV